ncbi:hypothetical protein Taro_003130 [Colocasia esculenta]|uniref:Uncharacterized protein n=1 Tax=Colocasia esculenta TaxID=4460 RepID=A0A843TMR0_COLES|nr:hypothetical protein [Colocasia esculenta]
MARLGCYSGRWRHWSLPPTPSTKPWCSGGTTTSKLASWSSYCEATTQEEEGQARGIDLLDLLLRLTFNSISGLTFDKDPKMLSLELHDNHFTTTMVATLQGLPYLGFP